MEREFMVGVFTHRGKGALKFMAYTRWYSTTWTGCCEHRVTAPTGREAKRRAITQHKARCEAAR